jgi:hypothetical protein
MKRIVISQPMFFPWVGLFEELRLADVYVHYDDVQFSKGSFTNRVQVKTPQGSKWLTVPLKNLTLGQLIKDVTLQDAQDWRQSHLSLLSQAYSGAPYLTDMLALISRVYERPITNLSELVIGSMEEICNYFDLDANRTFLKSSQLGISGKGSQRVLDIVKHLGGDVYVTGHGARNYLEHELFEHHGVSVQYMRYERAPYPQLHGAFDPHVTILDLIANTGHAGIEFIRSGTIPWRDFIHDVESG